MDTEWELKFSVLMSVYYKDSPRHLSLALDSISMQTLAPDEIVLVLDGPIPLELRDIIDNYISVFGKRLRIVPLERNLGLGAALNEGLRHCSHDLVARMDADDISLDDRFEKQLNLFRNDKMVSLVGGGLEEFSNVPGDMRKFRILPERHEDIFRFAKYRCPVNHPCVMFRKSAVLAAGSYLTMHNFEDYYLWVRMLRQGSRFYNIPDVLLYFRTGNNMIARRQGWNYMLKEQRLLRKMYDIGFVSYLRYWLLLLTRLPLRLIPRKLLIMIYKNFLR